MKKIVFAVLPLFFLVGCASSSQYRADEIVDANRSNGTVDVGFFHSGAPLTDNGEKADWTGALEVARNMCKKWGYSDAEPINNRINNKGIRNGYGYLCNGTVWARFLCTGEETLKVKHKGEK